MQQQAYGGVQLRHFFLSQSYEWWILQEYYIDPSFPGPGPDGSQYALPLDLHPVGGEVGWRGEGGISNTHIKYENGNLVLQQYIQSDYGLPQDYTIATNPAKGVWHSIVMHLILGRPGLSVPGHPNGGNGKVEIWHDGSNTPLVVNPTANLYPDKPGLTNWRATTRLAYLEGHYSQNATQQQICRITAGRCGTTLPLALADSAITKTGDIGVDSGASYVAVTPRSSADFILPTSLGG
jgi:hypothetical protein